MENSFIGRKEHSMQRELKWQRHGNEILHGLLVKALSSLVWEAFGLMRDCSKLKVPKSVVCQATQGLVFYAQHSGFV